MNHKLPKPPKPFPWKCNHCFKDEVVMGTSSYDAEIRHDGRLYKFTIPQLCLPICQACGEKVFTEKVDDQIGNAFRDHLHLLTSDEMRAGLDRLNLTQKEAAERLGIAEATLSRWLTDTQIQSKAMDNLLRAFFASSGVLPSDGPKSSNSPHSDIDWDRFGNVPKSQREKASRQAAVFQVA